MKKAVFSLFIFTVLVKITGLFRELSLSYAYGASNVSDAYIVSMTIPGVVFTFVGIAITTSYIPIFMRINNQINDNGTTNKYTSNLINISLLLSLLLYCGGFIFSRQIIKIFALGFDYQTLNLAVEFTRISLLGIFFLGVIYVLNGFLQSHNHYNFTSFVSIPVNLLATAFILLSFYTDVRLMVWGGIISLALHVGLLYFRSKKSTFKYRKEIDLDDENLKTTIRLALPLILGISVNQINVLVDRTIASGIIEGGISALNYANKLNMFVYGTLVVAVTTVIFPRISKLAVNNKLDKLSNEVKKSISLLLLLIIPATVGSMIFSTPIIDLIYGRGQFGSEALLLTSNALFYYSIGMVFVGIREILSRCFYAFNDSKTPSKNAIITVIVNIILNIILSKFMGISGLALATSISAIVSASLLLAEFKLKFNINIISNLLTNFIKIGISSLLMAIVSLSIFSNFEKHFSTSVTLLLSIFCGVIIYFALTYLLKVSEIEELTNIVFNKIFKRKGK